MKKFALTLAAVVALAGFSSTAHAVPVNVTFAISNTLGLPPLIANPGIGSGTGTMTLQFTGTTGSHISAGPVHLVSLSIQNSLNFTVAALGGMLITGSVNVTALQSAMGSVVGTSLILGAGNAYLTGNIHCGGAGAIFCTNPLVGLNPASSNNVVTGTVTFAIAAGVFNGLSVTPGVTPATIGWTGGLITFAGVTITGIFTGTEVSRNAIPEPSTFSLVAFGVLGLVGVARRHRRR